MLPTIMAQVAEARTTLLALALENMGQEFHDDLAKNVSWHVKHSQIVLLDGCATDFLAFVNRQVNVDVGIEAINKIHQHQCTWAVKNLTSSYDKKNKKEDKSVVLPVSVTNGILDLSAYADCEDKNLAEYVADGLTEVDFPSRFKYATCFVMLPLNGLSGLEGANYSVLPADDQEE